jgi:hypothetical protein
MELKELESVTDIVEKLPRGQTEGAASASPASASYLLTIFTTSWGGSSVPLLILLRNIASNLTIRGSFQFEINIVARKEARC